MKAKITEFLPYIIIILIVILIRGFIITPAKVDGGSMNPTLYDGQVILLNKISLKTAGIKRFDIVVVKIENNLLIKRVIALPGEKIEYLDNNLYIDGKLLEHSLKFEKTEDFSDEVKEGEYYLMGDNRGESRDSRYFGSIPLEDIKGKVKFILFPLKNIGKIK